MGDPHGKPRQWRAGEEGDNERITDQLAILNGVSILRPHQVQNDSGTPGKLP
jgi:hypothetical protein